MTAATVHRIIEQHAATRAGRVAIADGEREITYRDLNNAANTLARRLQAQGFRRGAHATVTMDRGIGLAVTLLAVLKLGGCYTWRETGPEQERGFSFPLPEHSSHRDSAPAVQQDARDAHGRAHARTSAEVRHLHLDLEPVLAAPIAASPNLPIVARSTDIACVLQDGDGSCAVSVPHAAIAALGAQSLPERFVWGGEPGALDLWLALTAGDTAIVVSDAAAAA